MRDLRNRIRHYVVDVAVEEAKAKLAVGLGFAIEFIEAHLETDLSHAQTEQKQEILKSLARFNEFVKERLTQINVLVGDSELGGCPNCFVAAVEFHYADGPTCHYCREFVDPEDWAASICEGPPVVECPECEEPCLAFKLYNNDNGGWFCTWCGYGTNEDIGQCARCNRTTTGDDAICNNCMADMVREG